ncbi:MAG: carbohydrate ABC transporter permease [Eubacteriales bacterium]|nr:carbohydrate ABC transporter permease [Eubacteriales bacterium]
MTTANMKRRPRQPLLQSRTHRKRIANIAAILLLLLLTFMVMLPIWWIFRSSLMTNAELYAYPPSFFPKVWRWYNYPETLVYFPFWSYLKNTLTIIVPSVLGATFTATLGGYAFARLRFRGRDLLFGLCVGSMLLPTMVTLVPLYIGWSRLLHLTDTYWPLILPHFCGGGAFSIFLIRQFIRSIPRELDEAATIDGCGYMKILFFIIMPAIKSAMIVIALLKFIELWNDLLQQVVYINFQKDYTIALGLSLFKGSLKSDWSKIMAATCMAFVPGVLFYLIGQRYFVEGIVMTGMKN